MTRCLRILPNPVPPPDSLESEAYTVSQPTVPSSTVPQAVILDWDGVIADSLTLYVELYQNVCKYFGKGTPPSSPVAFRWWYQPRWELNYLEMGYSQEELVDVLRYASTQLDYRQTPLFDAVVRSLRELAQEIPLAICSTTHAKHIHERLSTSELSACFSAIVGGEDGGSDKTERFGHAAQLLGIAPNAAIAVGDTPHDVECGKHWGMRTIGVTYGWCEPARVASAVPDRLVASPAQLGGTLREMLGRLT